MTIDMVVVIGSSALALASLPVSIYALQLARREHRDALRRYDEARARWAAEDAQRRV